MPMQWQMKYLIAKRPTRVTSKLMMSVWFPWLKATATRM